MLILAGNLNHFYSIVLLYLPLCLLTLKFNTVRTLYVTYPLLNGLLLLNFNCRKYLLSLFNYHPSFWKVNYKKSQFTNWQLNCQIVRKFPARKFKKHTTAHCQNTFLTLCTVLCMCKSAISGNFEYPKSAAREKYWTRVNEGFSSISP